MSRSARHSAARPRPPALCCCPLSLTDTHHRTTHSHRPPRCPCPTSSSSRAPGQTSRAARAEPAPRLLLTLLCVSSSLLLALLSPLPLVRSAAVPSEVLIEKQWATRLKRSVCEIFWEETAKITNRMEVRRQAALRSTERLTRRLRRSPSVLLSALLSLSGPSNRLDKQIFLPVHSSLGPHIPLCIRWRDPSGVHHGVPAFSL